MPEKTSAQKRAQKNYMSKFIRLEFRATPEQRDAIQAHAAARGESVNGFIGRAIAETMERDGKMEDLEMDAKITGFFHTLNGLSDRERVQLKRCAGKPLHESTGNGLTSFYKCMSPSVPEDDEYLWFLCACLHCMDDANIKRIRMENALRELRDGDAGEQIEHRMINILDSVPDDDTFPILFYKFFRMISMSYKIDCAALLDDFLHWSDDGQPVQRKWASGGDLS